MIQAFVVWRARRRLEKLIKARSFETAQYRKHREAGKKGWAHRQADRAGREPSLKSRPYGDHPLREAMP